MAIYKYISIYKYIGAPLNSLIDSTTSPKEKIVEGERIGVRSLIRSILGVEGCVAALGWGLG
jgi:hypothetical protein